MHARNFIMALCCLLSLLFAANNAAYSQNSTTQPTDTIVKTVSQEIEVNEALALAVKLKKENALLIKENLAQEKRHAYLDSLNRALENEIVAKDYHLDNNQLYIHTLKGFIYDLQKQVDSKTVSKWERRGRQDIVFGPSVSYGYSIATGWPVQRAATFGFSVVYRLGGFKIRH